ncbi:MAG: sulfotransferase [Rhodospirillales bacterium]
MNVAEQRFQLAVNLFNQGQLEAARQECQAALRLAPKQPDILHLLGLIAYRGGNLGEAEKLLTRASKVMPGHADCLFNLGVVLRDRGKLRDALRQFNRVVALRPDSIDALINLSLTQRDLGDLAAAEENSRKVVELAPRSSAGFNNLGVIYSLMNRFADAERAWRKAIDLKPDHFNAIRNLAQLFHRWDARAAKAGDYYRRAIDLAPGDLTVAIDYFDYLTEMGLLDEAEAMLERMRADFDAEPDLTLAEVRLLEARGRDADALVVLDDLSSRFASNDGVEHSLAKLLERTGRFDDAITHYRALAERNPADGLAYMALSDLVRFDVDDPLFAKMRRAAKRPDTDPLDVERLMFAMGRVQDRSGRFDDAFSSFAAGNRMRRARLDYDADLNERFIGRMCDVFDRERMAALTLTSPPGESPIFIVGMPRSGTTLAEQVLASHSKISAGGELTHMPANVRRQADRVGSEVPEFVADLSAEDIRELGQSYLAAVSPLAGAGGILTDKLPQNFLNVGIIRMIWPGARIIHTRRHPLATCFSIFSQLFQASHNYAYDLVELGRYYRDYRTLMAHWHSVCDEPIYDLDYETFVQNPEVETRRLLDYCGLEFEDACLAFHNTDRSVRTASRIQVRQPLYTSSLEHWRRYENHLRPLMEVIGDA